MRTDDEILREELKKLRAERKEIIEAYGNMAQYHPMHKDIGGLNPAAQRLHVVRGLIAKIERTFKGPSAVLTDKYGKNGRGGGLLYDGTFGGRSAMIGRSQGSPPHYFYVVEDGKIISENHKTLGAAVKSFEKGRR